MESKGRYTSKGRYDFNLRIEIKLERNNLKSLALIFQVAIHIHPSHPQPKTLVDSFSALI